MLLSGVMLGPGWVDRTSGPDGPGFADIEAEVPLGIFDCGGGRTSRERGPGFDGGNTSSCFGGEAGRGEGASVRLGRRRRPSSLMADIGRGRFNSCSRPALPVLAGGGGAGIAVPVRVGVAVGGAGVFVGAVGIFACVMAGGVFCTVISDEVETNEALVSACRANAFSAASRSAFCCRRILSTIRDDKRVSY
jgi:hypothetical protein